MSGEEAMDYKQAKLCVISINQSKSDPIDSFFLPFVLSLHYQVALLGNKNNRGTTSFDHQNQMVTANLSDDTKIIFFGSKDPKLDFDPNKIYIYIKEDGSLSVQIPRFTSMYEKFVITFDESDQDKSNYQELIDLITFRPDEHTDEKSMRSLQLDTDLNAFQRDENELLQMVIQIINNALAQDDIGLIQFIITKINTNYHTQFTNLQIMNILKEDFSRRQSSEHQYRLVDVQELYAVDQHKTGEEIQQDIAQERKDNNSDAQQEQNDQLIESSGDKVEEKSAVPDIMGIFYGKSSSTKKSPAETQSKADETIHESSEAQITSSEEQEESTHVDESPNNPSYQVNVNRLDEQEKDQSEDHQRAPSVEQDSGSNDTAEKNEDNKEGDENRGQHFYEQFFKPKDQ